MESDKNRKGRDGVTDGHFEVNPKSETSQTPEERQLNSRKAAC
jgi:hypothetical protein